MALTSHLCYIEHDETERYAEQNILRNNYNVEYLVKRFDDWNSLCMVSN